MPKTTATIRTEIEKGLHSRFKSACALEDLNMKDVVAELIQKWVEEREKQKK